MNCFERATYQKLIKYKYYILVANYYIKTIKTPIYIVYVSLYVSVNFIYHHAFKNYIIF